jgi:hypothetical protein
MTAKLSARLWNADGPSAARGAAALDCGSLLPLCLVPETSKAAEGCLTPRPPAAANLTPRPKPLSLNQTADFYIFECELA